MASITRYDLKWDLNKYDDAQIEVCMIQNGGSIKLQDGQPHGNGLFFHYRQLQSVLWPEDDHHRWSDLILKEILQNRITAILGPKDSGKTRTSSKYTLTDYYCFPEETLVLMSSTDLRGMELRIWGDLKSLHERARDRFEWVSGHVLDSKHAICTDDVEEGEVRDMRKGIICIPCMSSNGQFVGIGKFVGTKQKRRRIIGDEFSLMAGGMIDSIANMNSGDFKGIFVGNPIGQEDPLDKVSEPKDGWSSIPEPDKTTTWENRWIEGRTINLVGTDSPNFDPDRPKFYPYLINQKSIDSVVSFYGLDSLQYYSQCKGVRRSGLNARRVITRELCVQHGAMKDAVWAGGSRTRIAACDAAYGGIGGDRCVGGWAEFGADVDGGQVIQIYPPIIVPVSVKKPEKPEDQIASFMADYCKNRDIVPQNFGHDSTGRGSLGTAFARIWSPAIEPVEFGGAATNRPVSMDLKVWDSKEGKRRPKLCNEQYRKFVTELWFSVRLVIESGQLRGLPEEVLRDGCLREWKVVAGDKIEVEPKEDTKKRMGKSPDLFDWLVTIVEMARRRGFQITKLGNTDEDEPKGAWMDDLFRKNRSLYNNHQLTYK